MSHDADAAATPSPSTKIQSGHALSMLMKLVEESDTKSVAFTEEVGLDYHISVSTDKQTCPEV